MKKVCKTAVSERRNLGIDFEFFFLSSPAQRFGLDDLSWVCSITREFYASRNLAYGLGGFHWS